MPFGRRIVKPEGTLPQHWVFLAAGREVRSADAASASTEQLPDIQGIIDILISGGILKQYLQGQCTEQNIIRHRAIAAKEKLKMSEAIRSGTRSAATRRRYMQ